MPLYCPQCGQGLDPEDHADLVFDGWVWCRHCRSYDERLVAARPFAELEVWAAHLCQAFGQAAVILQRDPAYLPDPEKYRHGTTFLLAEADRQQRIIMLHPPGHRLTTLCHELAHLFTGQDHTDTWALTFAAITAWVKAHL